MEYKEAVNNLIKHNLRTKIVRCQNALRFYIHMHQQNVEKMQQAANADAKKAIVWAEQQMVEVQEEQRKVLKEVETILEEYAKKMSKRGKKFDSEYLYGAANRLISVELERAVAKARSKGGSDMRKSSGSGSAKRKRVSLLKTGAVKSPLEPFSLIRNLKELPSVINSKREAPAVIPLKDLKKKPPPPKSNQIKNSRMNLLEALKKARETNEVPIEIYDSSEDSVQMLENASEDDKIGITPLSDDENRSGNDEDDDEKLPPAIEKDFEFVGTIEEIPDDEEIDEEIELPAPKKSRKGPNSESSSEKSSRRSSDFEDLIVGQPDESLEDLGQERFLKYFGLFTAEQIDQLKTRRVSRRRRNCTSNVRKDFHYGQFDVNYVPVKNNKPVLYSPVDRISRYPKRKQQLDPLAVPPIVGPPSKIIIAVPPTQPASRRSIGNIVEAAIYKDMKTCVACQTISDVETMNACLLCYNFYHLQCHTMDRELRERENLCPDCLRQGLEKKKRRMELKKRLNFQVLQANHKASVAASMKNRHELQT
ncbi:uncharacterized protein LOC134834445 [Culicoides brevitarsis]|uniref:uncharacterized protein LOC134834445 n=1 Tax=Culicoides brevitarsis TaxID=469753 RepID=UPI00307BC289